MWKNVLCTAWRLEDVECGVEGAAWDLGSRGLVVRVRRIEFRGLHSGLRF